MRRTTPTPHEPRDEATTSETPSDDFVRRYIASMPKRYRALFDADAIRTHAGIVYRRGARATRIEPWRDLPGGGLAVCVVADDRPGLLSRISAALVAHAMDVASAQAYVRKRDDGRDEAVDFFWLARAPVPENLTPIRPF